MKIKKVLKDKEANSELIKYFNSIKDAADSINTTMEKWKVQLLISDAINSGKRAFKYNWYKA